MYPLTEACVCYITRTCSAIMSASPVSHTGSSWWAGQTWPRLIPCRCMLAGYGWWVCHAAQRRASALPRFLHASTHFVLDLSPQVTPETHHHPRTCMGILHDLPQAHTAYDARATQHTTLQAAALYAHLARAFPGVVATGHGTAASYTARSSACGAERRPVQQPGGRGHASVDVCAGGAGAVDEAREAQAGLPACDVWRQTQEDA